jgi:hypothetical protein
MAMMKSAAYAIYPQSVALTEVMKTLGQGGFEKENICMMFSAKHPITTIVREANSHVFEREANAVSAGLIGWLSEFGAVVIPTFGFFMRSREFFHSLVVEQDSMARCGQRGTLAGLGFAEDDAAHVEDQLREAGVFLYIACPEAARTRWALELLRATGAKEAGLLEDKAGMPKGDFAAAAAAVSAANISKSPLFRTSL